MLDPDRHRRFAGRTLALLAVLAFLLLGVGAYVLLPHPGGTSPEERYLQHLDAYGLSDQFRSDQAALASGRRVCRRLEQGAPRTGYQRDFVAVKDLCPRYQEGFELRRTPEQLADVLATRLDAAGQADAFDSTSDAVRRAEGLCRELRDGHDQKGTPADRIAVEVYCPEKLFRFREFRKTTALGSFTLRVSKLDPLAPPISTTGPICTGAHQFAGYHLGTRVTVTNGQGDRLGVTSLRSGSGSSTECVFTFAVELTEGEDAYVFQVGDLPGESYSFDDVLMGQVRQELKSR